MNLRLVNKGYRRWLNTYYLILRLKHKTYGGESTTSRRTAWQGVFMDPQPEIIKSGYRGSSKLKDRVALITGGDSGIGRAIAVHFAREGADVAIVHQAEEQEDADTTAEMVEKEGRKCLLISGDLREADFCERVVSKTVQKFGKLNIVVNNAAEQFVKAIS